MGLLRSVLTGNSRVGVAGDVVVVAGATARLVQNKRAGAQPAIAPAEALVAAFALFRIIRWLRSRRKKSK